MLHLKPISEEKASEKVKELYQDVKKTLKIDIVPLLFQYLGNFEEYFAYAWEMWKQNITSREFSEFYDEVLKFSCEAIEDVYTASSAISVFMQSLHEEEKKNIQSSVNDIEHINATLFLLTIGLREGLKGVTVGQQLLPKLAGVMNVEFEGIFDEYINSQRVRSDLQNKKDEIKPGEKMLAPLFGAQTLTLSRYSDFFSRVAHEMEKLLRTQPYLEQRVILEHIGLLSVSRFPYPLGCSYSEIARFAFKKPYYGELLYILSETFPSTFPHLVLTSAVMQELLNAKKSTSLVAQE